MAGAKGRQVEFDLVQLGGVDTRVWQGDGTANDIKGAVFTLRGEVAKSMGIAPLITSWDGGNPFSTNPILALGAFTWGGATDIIMAYADKVRIVAGLAAADIYPAQANRYNSGRSRDAARFVQANDVLIILNGRDGNLKWDGRKVTPLGISSLPPAPNEPQAWNEGTTATHLWTPIMLTGNTAKIAYRQTWINDKGQESEPGPQSTALDYTGSFGDTTIGTTDNFVILVTGLASTPPSDDIVARRLYRTSDGGTTWLFLADIPGCSTDTYWDHTPVGSEGGDLMPDIGTNSAPPIATWAFAFQGRIYYGGVADAPSILFYSREDGGKEAVSVGAILDVESSDGDVLTGGIAVQDFAVVFKRRSIHLLTLDKDGAPKLVKIASGMGAAGDRCIASFDGKVYFLDSSGLFIFDGARVKPLSREINRAIAQLPQSYLADACAFVDTVERRVYLSVCSGPADKPDEVWVIHADSGAWSRLPFQVYSALPYKGEILVGCRYLTGGTDVNDLGLWGAGYVLGVDEGYDGDFQTKWIDIKNPESDKTFYRVDFAVVGTGSHSMTVEWAVDWDDRTTVGSTTFTLSDDNAVVWNSGNWDPVTRKWDGPRLFTKRVDLLPTTLAATNGKAIRLRWKTTGINTPWKVVGFTLFYADHGMRSEGSDT